MTQPKTLSGKLYILFVVVTLVGCLWILQAPAATVYIWKDAKGVIHVTNQIPSEDTKNVKRLEYEPEDNENSETVPDNPRQEKYDDQKKKLQEKANALKEQAAEALSNARKSRKVAAETRAQAEKLQNLYTGNKTFKEKGEIKSAIKKLMDKSVKAEERERDLQIQAEEAERRAKRIENRLKKMK